MGCCCCCRKKKTLEVSFRHRHCTDPICFVLFCLFWFVSIVILIAAYRTADTSAYWPILLVWNVSLTFGRDYNGDVCGSTVNNPGSAYYGCETGICTQVYYPRINEDMSVSIAFVWSLFLLSILEHILFSLWNLSSKLSHCWGRCVHL